MMKRFLIAVCLLVTAGYAASANAGVIMNVTLANLTQSDTEVVFDIAATFREDVAGDFIDSMQLVLDSGSLQLGGGGPLFGRFSLETDGFPWDGGLDVDNGLIILIARSTPLLDTGAGPAITLARLHVNTQGLDGVYEITFDTPSFFAQGTLQGNPGESLPGILGDFDLSGQSFKVAQNQNVAVPEPSSLCVFELCTIAMMLGRRKRK